MENGGLKYQIGAIYYSRKYPYLYLLLMIMSAMSIFFLLFFWEDPKTWVQVLEISVMLGTTVDSLARLIVLGLALAFATWWNKVDYMIAQIYAIIIVISVFVIQDYAQYTQLVGLSLVTGKLSVQYLKHFEGANRRYEHNSIDFSDLSEVHREPDPHESGIILLENTLSESQPSARKPDGSRNLVSKTENPMISEVE